MTLRRVLRPTAVAVAALAGALALPGVASAGPSTAAAIPTAAGPTVVLFAVPGLQWSDVTAMPALAGLAARGSVSQLGVRTSGATTHCLAGSVAVSAGNRTDVIRRACHVGPITFGKIRKANRHNEFTDYIGALGAALDAAGIPTTAVGRNAVPLLANRHGHVGRTTTNAAAALRRPGVVALLDNRIYRSTADTRAIEAQAVDTRLARVEAMLGPATNLIVAGISDNATGGTHLHTLVITGPGWHHDELTALPPGRPRYVEIIDLGPTILSILHVAVPSTMVGDPVRVTGAPPPGIAAYVDNNRHASAAQRIRVTAWLSWLTAVILALALLAARFYPAAVVGRLIARVLAPAPVMGYIANALPWWRWGDGVYPALVVGGCLIVALGTTLAARHGTKAAVLVVPAVTFVALAIDQVTGGTLQRSSPIGYNPLNAGRFYGAGNIDFAMVATAAVLTASVVTGGMRRRVAVPVGAAILALAIIVDAAPMYGDDFGGLFTLLPASIILVVLIAKLRVTAWRLVGAAAATVVVAVGVALADYSRPPDRQTHIGRFVGQVLHGGAWSEVDRKLHTGMHTVGLTAATLVVAMAALAFAIGRRRLWAAVDTVPGLRAGVIAAAIVGILGSILNDSGIVVASISTTVAFATVYGAGVRAPSTPPAMLTSADSQSGERQP